MYEIFLRFMRPDAQQLYGGMLHFATPASAGVDLRACFQEQEYCLDPQERLLVPSGIAIQPHYSSENTETAPSVGQSLAGFVYSRSGLGAKHGICVAQGVGVIDADYRGEIMIMLLNTSTMPYTLQRGERVAQLVFQPIIRPTFCVREALDESERGSGGFGHTGQA